MVKTTLKLLLLRVFLSLTTCMGLKVEVLDVSNAFLNVSLTEEIYLKIPEGYAGYRTNRVWELNKALYGLKQSPLEWNRMLNSFLIELGYTHLESDQCL
jgi:hypothetical protein